MVFTYARYIVFHIIHVDVLVITDSRLYPKREKSPISGTKCYAQLYITLKMLPRRQTRTNYESGCFNKY